jgi:hypothetical protein
MKSSGIEDIRDLFRDIGQEIGVAIGESMVEAVRSQLPRLREEIGQSAAGGPAVRRVTASSTRGAKVSAALTRPCPVPGCTRPGRGPRFSFLCDIHRELPASEREKYRIRPRRGE